MANIYPRVNQPSKFQVTTPQDSSSTGGPPATLTFEGVITKIEYPATCEFDHPIHGGWKVLKTGAPTITITTLPRKPRANKLIPKLTAEEHGVRVYRPTILGPIVTWHGVNLADNTHLQLTFSYYAFDVLNALYERDPDELIVLPHSRVLKLLGIPHVTTRGHVFDVLARLVLAYERPEYRTEWEALGEQKRLPTALFEELSLLSRGWGRINSAKQADLIRRRAIKKRKKAASKLAKDRGVFAHVFYSEPAFMHLLLRIEVGNYYYTCTRDDVGGVFVREPEYAPTSILEALSNILTHVDNLVLAARPYQPNDGLYKLGIPDTQQPEEQETSE